MSNYVLCVNRTNRSELETSLKHEGRNARTTAVLYLVEIRSYQNTLPSTNHSIKGAVSLVSFIQSLNCEFENKH